MCPSTDARPDDHESATAVLQDLLGRIALANRESGRDVYLVSHAWTQGRLLYVVYTAPPSNRTWGLVRDTTQSIINPGPWDSHDNPAHFYYRIDFEENQPSSSMRPPDEPDTIWWFGHPRHELPRHIDEITEDKRYSGMPSVSLPADRATPPAAEPRRYGNPN
jgi:hypothetical protein